MFLPADCELLFHLDVPLETLLDLVSGLLDVLLPFLFEYLLNLIELPDALIPECEVLFSHLADQHFDVTGLFLEGLGVLVVFLLEFLPELADEFVLGGHDLGERLLLFVDGLGGRIDTLERDSHSSYSLSSDHLIYRAVFFLLEATASCWIEISLS